MIELVLAVERLQIGQILLEDVDIRLQEGLSKRLKRYFNKEQEMKQKQKKLSECLQNSKELKLNLFF